MEQPLFDATDYNGFGRKKATSFDPTGGSVQKLVSVKNNEAVESYTEIEIGSEKGIVYDVKLKKYKNIQDIDNWAVSFFDLLAIWAKTLSKSCKSCFCCNKTLILIS